MLSKTMQEALNEQLKHELYSAYLYLSMAAYYEANNLSGFAHWMRLQAQEEQSHALKFFDFIVDRGGRVTLQAIAQPPVEFQSPRHVFEQTLEHERQVTSLIHQLYKSAQQENDYPTQVMLQWFISEQVEEEKNAAQILDTMQMAGDKGQVLVMLDRALGQRGKG